MPINQGRGNCLVIKLPEAPAQALAEDDLVDAPWRDVRYSSQCVLADAKWLDEFREQDFAGVDIGKRLHDESRGRSFPH